MCCAGSSGKPDLGFLQLAPETWVGTENISIDCAVKE